MSIICPRCALVHNKPKHDSFHCDCGLSIGKELNIISFIDNKYNYVIIWRDEYTDIHLFNLQTKMYAPTIHVPILKYNITLEQLKSLLAFS